MRKFAIIAVAACVVVVIVLALLPQFLDVNHYRPRIQAELQNRLGRSVSLGNIKASFLPPSLIVSDERNPRTQVNLRNVVCERVPLLLRFRDSGKEIAGVGASDCASRTVNPFAARTRATSAA